MKDQIVMAFCVLKMLISIIKESICILYKDIKELYS